MPVIGPLLRPMPRGCGAHDARAGGGEAGGNRVESLRAAAERGEEDDEGTRALRKDFDVDFTAVDDGPSHDHDSPLPACGERSAVRAERGLPGEGASPRVMCLR